MHQQRKRERSAFLAADRYIDGKAVGVSGAVAGICFLRRRIPRLALRVRARNLLLHLLQQIALPFHFTVFDLEQDERARKAIYHQPSDQIRTIGRPSRGQNSAVVHLHQSGLGVDRRQYPSALHFDQLVLRLAVIFEMVPVRRRQHAVAAVRRNARLPARKEFVPNCGPGSLHRLSASWARQSDAAKIDITPHKIGTAKIVFMSVLWNPEAGRSTALTFLRSNRLWLRVQARAPPPKSILFVGTGNTMEHSLSPT